LIGTASARARQSCPHMCGSSCSWKRVLWLLLLVRARGSFAYVFREELRCMYQVCCLLCRRHRPPQVGRLVFVCFPGCRLDLLMPQELVQACKGGGREQHQQYQRQCETEALELVASTVQCKGLPEVSRLPMSSTAQVVGQVCFIWAIAVGRCLWWGSVLQGPPGKERPAAGPNGC